MISYKNNEYLLYIKDELWKFYKNDEGSICYSILKDNSWSQEIELVDSCEQLLSVILSANGSIYILSISSSKSLVLYTYKENYFSENVLLNFSFEVDHIQVISLNNALNLIYTKYDNNTYCLYHRIITSNLTITPPIMLDIVEKLEGFPFIAYVQKKEIITLYVKKLKTYYIGYRTYSPQQNFWGKYTSIDRCPTKPYDYSFAIDENNVIAISYSIKDSSASLLKYGFLIDNNFSAKALKSNESIDTYSSLIYKNNVYYLIYNFKNTIFITSLFVNGDLDVVERVPYSSSSIIEKYILQSDSLTLNSFSSFIVNDKNNILFSPLSILNMTLIKPEKSDDKKTNESISTYYEKQIISKNKTIQKLLDQVNSLQTHIKKLETVATINNTIEREAQNLKKEIVTKESNIHVTNKLLADYESKYKDTKLVIDNLKTQVSVLENKLQSYEGTINTLTLKNKELSDALTLAQESRIDTTNLTLLLQDKDKDIANLKYLNSSLQVQIDRLTQQIDMLSIEKDTKVSFVKRLFK
ncbi:hypothetical protein [Clostridium sp. YIM B02551]|uniref:hypothetical protein n=1 Tax=Clostridium sp. YIM B02551 TaxID=2910679 RepID=UPI001EEA04E2|nr:hypothetical protein [Clostridium sp. YIM B02551]